MSESGDYDPGPWKGYDFNSARTSYDAHVGRSYTAAVAKKVPKKAVMVASLKTNSRNPLVVVCDVTGSMGDWPAVIFSKLPYLDIEAKTYLGDDCEICFSAVGDVFSDQYPLQITEFGKGKVLEENLKKFIIEKNGGSQYKESYDMPALYFTRNVEMPNAIRPVLIFIGDEGLYNFVDQQHAKDLCGVDVKLNDLTIEKLFFELQQRYSVYLIRKHYGSRSATNKQSDLDQQIEAQWAKLIGDDHIALLPSADRVVDVIFGILAAETGKEDYFKKEITDRQTPAQVKTVMKSLVSVHHGVDDDEDKKEVKKSNVGKSVTHTNMTGKASKSLLD